jgi:hypothetical protein
MRRWKSFSHGARGIENQEITEMRSTIQSTCAIKRCFLSPGALSELSEALGPSRGGLNGELELQCDHALQIQEMEMEMELGLNIGLGHICLAVEQWRHHISLPP